MSDIKTPLLKQRDSWYDNAKAFLIVCVVIGHLANGSFSTVTSWVLALQEFIYVFHMPAFMIITGRFAKKRVDNGDWVSVVNKVVVPYVLCQTLMLPVYTAFDSAPKNFNYFYPLFGLWYFMNIAVYTIITTHLKKIKYLFPLSFIAVAVICFLPNALYGGFHRLVTYYPFFLFGYYTQKYDFSFCKKIPFRLLSYILFCAMGIYVLINQWDVNFEVLCLNKPFSVVAAKMEWTILETACHYVLRYILGFVSFFMVLGMVPTKRMFFTYVGENSSYVYVIHCFLIIILRKIDGNHDILRVLTDKWRLLAYCFSGVPIAFVLASKPIRKLFRFLVEPDFDLKRIAQRLTDTNKDK